MHYLNVFVLFGGECDTFLVLTDVCFLVSISHASTSYYNAAVMVSEQCDAQLQGERLSHAVGCAFAICLEKKQQRDKEVGVTVTYNQDATSFTRTGSFRQATLTERIVDPQSAIVAGGWYALLPVISICQNGTDIVNSLVDGY